MVLVRKFGIIFRDLNNWKISRVCALLANFTYLFDIKKVNFRVRNSDDIA